jgi:hypothetical protein
LGHALVSLGINVYGKGCLNDAPHVLTYGIPILDRVLILFIPCKLREKIGQGVHSL